MSCISFLLHRTMQPQSTSKDSFLYVQVHVEWVKSWIETLSLLQLYVKEHHTTGLVWNPKGINALEAAKSDLSATPSKAAPAPVGAPPPPPPPPPPALTDFPAPQPDAKSALLDSLNRGEDVTKGLKKVEDSEKTHKNPELRASSKVPSTPAKPSASSKTTSAQAEKPPKIELDGKKWNVEYVNGNPEVVIDASENSQSVYIFRCNGSTFQIKVTSMYKEKQSNLCT